MRAVIPRPACQWRAANCPSGESLALSYCCSLAPQVHSPLLGQRGIGAAPHPSLAVVLLWGVRQPQAGADFGPKGHKVGLWWHQVQLHGARCQVEQQLPLVTSQCVYLVALFSGTYPLIASAFLRSQDDRNKISFHLPHACHSVYVYDVITVAGRIRSVTNQKESSFLQVSVPLQHLPPQASCRARHPQGWRHSPSSPGRPCHTQGCTAPSV